MSAALSVAPQNRIMDYVNKLTAASPSEAVQIALAEAERARATSEQAQAEYRAMSECKFDANGRITEANMAGLFRLAQAYAGSSIVPEQYRGKPSDCFIAVQMAFRLGVDPLAYMQSSYIVHGKPGIEAKLAIAMLNTSGKITGRVRYKDERDKAGKMIASTATVKDAETGDEVAATVTWEMAAAEGWTTKTGSKWKTMPDVMFHYRAAVFLIRQFYPEVLMGMQTRDELDDLPEVAAPAANIAELHARIDGPTNGNGQADIEDAADQAQDDAKAPESDTADRRATTPEPDPLFLDEARQAAESITAELSIDVFRNEYLPKCKTDAETTAVEGFADQACQRIIAAREARKGKK